jgi:hypothetical protein
LIAHFEEVVIILDPLQAVAVRDLVLVQKDLAGALKRRWNDEAAASVVEGREDDRGRSCLFHAVQLRSFGSWADDADDGDRRCWGLGSRGWRWGLVELGGLGRAMDLLDLDG